MGYDVEIEEIGLIASILFYFCHGLDSYDLSDFFFFFL